MYALTRLGSAVAIAAMVFVGASVWSPGQVETQQLPQPSARQQDASELSQLKSDVVQLQALLNQMQATYGLVGNPTAPANHELQLNMEMWRILIGQMQRHISRIEEEGKQSQK